MIRPVNNGYALAGAQWFATREEAEAVLDELLALGLELEWVRT